ncbi:hypothetical protein ACFLWG_01220 [Chloroflexota bacterium]
MVGDMVKFTAKYQYKVPRILMRGEEVVEPIKLAIKGGQVTIYPPEGKEPKQNDLWDADSGRIVLEIDVTKPTSEKEANEVVRKSEREVQQIVFRFLRLLRRKLKVPFALPMSLDLNTSYQWEGWKPTGFLPLASAMMVKVFVVSQDSGLTDDKWQKLYEEMQRGTDTELWEDFIEDSKVALRDKDLNRATLYSAIACEIFIKEYTEKIAKEKGVSPIFWEYLIDPGTETRVLTYYNEILHLIIGHSLKGENIELNNKLTLIFNARNKIMHDGRLPSKWNTAQINQLAESIKASESIISWVIGFEIKTD